MRKVRNSVFETNSSSCHSLTTDDLLESDISRKEAIYICKDLIQMFVITSEELK